MRVQKPFDAENSADIPKEVRVSVVSSRPILRLALANIVCLLPGSWVVAQGAHIGDIREIESDVILVDLWDCAVSEFDLSDSRPVIALGQSKRGTQEPPSEAVVILPWTIDPAGLQAALRGRLHLGQGATRLTERQSAVLALAAQGMSARSIAARLAIAEGTVKRHLSAAYAALNATSRIDAINRARLLGFLE